MFQRTFAAALSLLLARERDVAEMKRTQSRKPDAVACAIVGVTDPVLDFNADGTFTLVATCHSELPNGDVADFEVVVEDMRIPQLAAAVNIALAARAAAEKK